MKAFARENGVPGSKYISRIDKRTHLPLYAIGTTVTVSALLALINIGSTQAFQAFISLLIASYYSAFMIAASVLLKKRLSNEAKSLPWGPFTMGRAGIPIIVVAMAYTVMGTFFSFWPFTPAVTPQTMNFSVLLFGGAVIFSVVFYVAYGRKVYQGPVYELSQ